jgi:hypothetical protein
VPPPSLSPEFKAEAAEKAGVVVRAWGSIDERAVLQHTRVLFISATTEWPRERPAWLQQARGEGRFLRPCLRALLPVAANLCAFSPSPS